MTTTLASVMGRKLEQPCVANSAIHGVCPKGKMLEFRIDRQVTVLLNLLLKFTKRFTVEQAIIFIVMVFYIYGRGIY